MTTPMRDWVFSPDPTIERIWKAREALEEKAGGDVRKLVAIAADAARLALKTVRTRVAVPTRGEPYPQPGK